MLGYRAISYARSSKKNISLRLCPSFVRSHEWQPPVVLRALSLREANPKTLPHPIGVHQDHPTYRKEVARVVPVSPLTNAKDGAIKLGLKKASWFSFVLLGSLGGTYMTFDPSHLLIDFSVFFVSTGICVLFGHSLGMHRLFIHRAYKCSAWLEYLLVHLGTLMGIAGPLGMMKAHDLRDWAQRQPPNECHPYYSQQEILPIDSHWQMCCDFQLDHPPQWQPPADLPPIYYTMEKYWILQQLPLMILLGLLGGPSAIVWGSFNRLLAGMYGHFLTGWFAHNLGFWGWKNNDVKGVAIQGINVGLSLQRIQGGEAGGQRPISRGKILAILTAGESYHNNHHAFPRSANLAIKEGEWDLGYKVLKIMESLGLVWDIQTWTQQKKDHLTQLK